MCCNYGDMRKVLEAEPICPMCEKHVDPMQIMIS
jgi:hypothetical protein